MELGTRGGDRLAQAGAHAGEAGADGITVRALEHHRQQTLAQLPQVPPGFPAARVARLSRQPQDRHAHDLLGDFGGDDLGNIGYAIDVDDGDGERHLAQRSQRHRLFETPKEPTAVELQSWALIGALERIIVRSRCRCAHHTDRALGAVGAGARLIGASAVLKARFRRRAHGNRSARQLLEQRGNRPRPDGLEPLADAIP
jgi:hypothetical protein